LEIEKELTYSSLSSNVFELSKNNRCLHKLSVNFQIDPCSIKLANLINQNPTKIGFWNRIQELTPKKDKLLASNSLVLGCIGLQLLKHNKKKILKSHLVNFEGNVRGGNKDCLCLHFISLNGLFLWS
jgi:hypothetical protein